jgi:hypothetical protein
MNGYSCQMLRQYSYMTQCPYANTCPVRNQCPVCPHRQEQSYPASQGYYRDIDPYNEYFNQTASEPYLNSSFEEYGYNNLYPQENIYIDYSSQVPFYDSINYRYMDPRENIVSSWDNNRRFENNLENALSLPERPFG